MFWYTLFVKTGYEQLTVKEISRGWSIDGLRPFVPMYDTYFRKFGKVHKEKRCLFPGYIFIETELKGNDFYIAAHPYIIRSEYVMKILRYGSGYESRFAMKENESQILLKLYNNEYCVEMSKGFIEGDSIIITDGPLMGFESCIKKINRHKMEVVIEIEMMGCLRDVTIGLEVIEKLPKN